MDLVNLSHFGGCSKISTMLALRKYSAYWPKLLTVSKIKHAGTVYLGIKNVLASTPMFITNMWNTMVSLWDKHFTRQAFSSKFPARLASSAIPEPSPPSPNPSHSTNTLGRDSSHLLGTMALLSNTPLRMEGTPWCRKLTFSWALGFYSTASLSEELVIHKQLSRSLLTFPIPPKILLIC